ncbi:MAG: hypothetical protein KC502_20655, partial [Myxococcales bacterium]|nr:hypothetical protein [Myxococcales bacterium]
MQVKLSRHGWLRGGVLAALLVVSTGCSIFDDDVGVSAKPVTAIGTDGFVDGVIGDGQGGGPEVSTIAPPEDTGGADVDVTEELDVLTDVDNCDGGPCSCAADSDCASDEVCADVDTAGAVTKQCVKRHQFTCDPCGEDSTCSHPGDKDAACVGLGKIPGLDGWFCASSCATDDDCPATSQCEDRSSAGGAAGKWCVPKTGECTCSDAAIAAGLSTACSVTADGVPGASCPGKRVCINGGLTGCDGTTPVKEKCDGIDTDCDGALDNGELCDDGNICTKDDCNGAAGCSHPSANVKCDDGNKCTLDDACADKLCKGTAAVCFDGDSCTDDACDPAVGCTATNATTCDDGDACTTDACDPAIGCTATAAPPCDDKDACT